MRFNVWRVERDNRGASGQIIVPPLLATAAHSSSKSARKKLKWASYTEDNHTSIKVSLCRSAESREQHVWRQWVCFPFQASNGLDKCQQSPINTGEPCENWCSSVTLPLLPSKISGYQWSQWARCEIAAVLPPFGNAFLGAPPPPLLTTWARLLQEPNASALLRGGWCTQMASGSHWEHQACTALSKHRQKTQTAALPKHGELNSPGHNHFLLS